MNISVVITLYNYEKFVVETIESILNQTRFDLIKEILIIDDGSTDNSLQVIQKYKDKIKIISKENGGQLSAFNKAYEILTGDIVHFIDADDILYPDFYEKIINYFKIYDVIFVRREYFGKKNFLENKPFSKDFGFSYLRTFYLKKWIGSSTSAILFKKDILDKILPLKEIEKDWKIRADDCLVFGSSLVGARKFYNANILIKYRIHENNNFFNKTVSSEEKFIRWMNINKLFKIILKKNNIVIDDIQIIYEFLSIKDKNLEDLKDYIKICYFSKLSFLTKIFYIIKLISIEKNQPKSKEIK